MSLNKSKIKCLFGYHVYGGTKYQVISQRNRDYVFQLCGCGTAGQISQVYNSVVVSEGSITGPKSYVGYGNDDRNLVYYVGSGWQLSKIFFERYPELLQLFDKVIKKEEVNEV